MAKLKYFKERLDFSKDNSSAEETAKLLVKEIQENIKTYKSTKSRLLKMIEDAYDLETDDISKDKQNMIAKFIGENQFLIREKAIILKNIEYRRLEAKSKTLAQTASQTTDQAKKTSIADETKTIQDRMKTLKTEGDKMRKDLDLLLRNEVKRTTDYLKNLEKDENP